MLVGYQRTTRAPARLLHASRPHQPLDALALLRATRAHDLTEDHLQAAIIVGVLGERGQRLQTSDAVAHVIGGALEHRHGLMGMARGGEGPRVEHIPLAGGRGPVDDAARAFARRAAATDQYARLLGEAGEFCRR